MLMFPLPSDIGPVSNLVGQRSQNCQIYPKARIAVCVVEQSSVIMTDIKYNRNLKVLFGGWIKCLHKTKSRAKIKSYVQFFKCYIVSWKISL